MKAVLVAALCLIEIAVAHLLALPSEEFITIWQAELVILAVLGLLSDGGRRDRSVLTIFFLWFTWILITDWAIIEVPALLVEYEAVIFSALVLWAMIRPYYFSSDPVSESTVCIAFYRGTQAPLLSSLSSLIGLPFSSVAVLAGGLAVRASSAGRMVAVDWRGVLEGDFVCVDTGVKCSSAISEAIRACTGVSTKSAGLRMKCIANLIPILKEIGYEPKTIFHKIPSIFYFQCVRQANKQRFDAGN